jgi:hypothetical protein
MDNDNVADLVKAFQRATHHIRRLHNTQRGYLDGSPEAYIRNYGELQAIEARLRDLGFVKLAVNLRIEHDYRIAVALCEAVRTSDLDKVRAATRWHVDLALGRRPM